MEVTELTLWIARLGVLALMYVFVLALIFALVADARAAAKPREAAMLPATPSPLPSRVAAPTLSASPITLTVIGGTPPSTGREYHPLGPMQIGRDAACDVVIPSHFVSKHHARISQAAQWMVEDLGSTNGSMLNGEPLTTPRPLSSGDRLMIGDTEFLVK